MMRRTVTALVFAALLSTAGLAQERDARRELPPVVAGTLEKRGFAVDATSEAGLVGTYRFPGPDAVYVSSDAGLALYLLLLRRALDEVAFVGDAALVDDALAWDAAVRASSPAGEAGRVARFVTGFLCAIVDARTAAEDDVVLADVAGQLARVRGTAATTGIAELIDTPFDDERLATLISNPVPERARWDAAIFWATRVRLPATPTGDAGRRRGVPLLGRRGAAVRRELVRARADRSSTVSVMGIRCHVSGAG